VGVLWDRPHINRYPGCRLAIPRVLTCEGVERGDNVSNEVIHG